VLESSPCRDWPEALILAAQAHIRLGDVSEARASLDRALALDSDNSEARQLLASIEKGPQETVAEA
jgi:Flp pilus assembly protein TadD